MVEVIGRSRHSVAEWEQHLGDQIRRTRLDANLSQELLAHHADVAVSTIHNLEAGFGSSLSTVIKVARALGREQWLDDFSPPVQISPMQLLRDRQQPARSGSRRRASPARAPGGS